VQKNTVLEFDKDNDEDLKALPACVRLFLVKFVDINSVSGGVASESIEGLSQSFDTTNKGTLIWQYAEELLSGYLKTRIRFVAATDRWN
jgi:hypothetical protein